MERRKMSISCIIPFFNRSEKVLRCLNSINGIDIPDIEFLLIDDGSNESESNIIRSEIKRDQRIKYKKIVKQGVSAARNIGLQNASKKWIVFIDSDDQIDAGEFNSIVRNINDETDVYNCYPALCVTRGRHMN